MERGRFLPENREKSATTHPTLNNSRKIKGTIEDSSKSFRREKGLKKREGKGDLSSPIAKKSAIPAAADSNYIFGHRWNFGAIRKGGRGEDDHRSPIVLITWRALGPARSFLLFLLIRFWHQLSPRELCYLCGYRHVKIHLPLFIQRGPLRCADVD